MLNKELTEHVKFHQIPNAQVEWIEYPSEAYIVEDTREEGY